MISSSLIYRISLKINSMLRIWFWNSSEHTGKSLICLVMIEKPIGWHQSLKSFWKGWEGLKITYRSWVNSNPSNLNWSLQSKPNQSSTNRILIRKWAKWWPNPKLILIKMIKILSKNMKTSLNKMRCIKTKIS